MRFPAVPYRNSLGSLSRLLTRRQPFDGRDRNELLREIGDDDPPTPQSWPTIRNDRHSRRSRFTDS